MSECDRLLQAIHRGDIAQATQLIDQGLDLNCRCDDGATPLDLAILKGYQEVVRSLLKHGADPNLFADEPAASVYAKKPLDLAMQARFLMDWDRFHPIVTTLIEYGATDSDGETESRDQQMTREQRARDHQRNK